MADHHAHTSRAQANDADLPEMPANRSMDDIDLQEEPSTRQQEDDFDPDEYDDEIDSTYFQSSRRNAHILNSSRMSYASSQFRDTELSEIEALKTMRIQSLTSILNTPKDHSFVKKIGSLVKDNIKINQHLKKGSQKKYKYRQLTEKEINDSYQIPKVRARDFTNHLQQTEKHAGEYMKNRSLEEQKRMQKAVINRASNLSTNSQKYLSAVDKVVAVPAYFNDEEYKLDRQLLKLPEEEVKEELRLHEKYLSIVNTDMESTILKNFDFFNKAFINFEDVKEEMKQLSTTVTDIRAAHKRLKMNQLASMIQVYRLQRKKANEKRVWGILKYLTVLQQSIPVIDNLIQNADSISSFDMALQLIKNANDIILANLNGVTLADRYKRKLALLRQDCVKKIELKRSAMLTDYLLKLIAISKKPIPIEEQEASYTNELVCQFIESNKAPIESLEMSLPHLKNYILQSWIFVKMDIAAADPQITEIKQCIQSILKSDEQTVNKGKRQNLDNMILSLRTTLSNMLKEYNDKLLVYLQSMLSQNLEKGGEDGPVHGLKQELPQGSKLIFKTLSIAIQKLYQEDSLEDLEQKLLIKSDLIYLPFSGFALQALIYVHLGNVLGSIEELVIGQVEEWNRQQRDSEAFLLMSTKDQQLAKLSQERDIKMIKSQFQDQKANLSTSIQNKLDKLFKQINEGGEQGLLNFLIIPPASISNEAERRAASEKQSDLVLLLNMLTMVSSFLKEQQSVKTQLINFDGQLEDFQKSFVAHLKSKMEKELLDFFEKEETYQQYKDISETDHEVVIARLMSPNFAVSERQPSEKKFPMNSFAISNLKYKVFACQVKFNSLLDLYIQTYFDLPSQAVKGFDASLRVLEFIKVYNEKLEGQILQRKAISDKKVANCTIKHLAFSVSCVLLILNQIFPNLKDNLLVSPLVNTNLRKCLDDEIRETEAQLVRHKDEVFKQFQKVLVDQVSALINKMAPQVDWESPISKGTIIEPAKYVIEVNGMISNVFKQIRQNIASEQSQIEIQIMDPTFRDIIKVMDDLFMNQLKSSGSRAVKKRIKVDIKTFIKNCMSAEKMKLTMAFKEQHFNLLVSRDFSQMDEKAIEALEPPTEAEIQAITVHDKYSAIKQSLKNILINHCGCKNEELPKLFGALQQQAQAEAAGAEEDASPEKQTPDAKPKTSSLNLKVEETKTESPQKMNLDVEAESLREKKDDQVTAKEAKDAQEAEEKAEEKVEDAPEVKPEEKAAAPEKVLANEEAVPDAEEAGKENQDQKNFAKSETKPEAEEEKPQETEPKSVDSPKVEPEDQQPKAEEALEPEEKEVEEQPADVSPEEEPEETKDNAHPGEPEGSKELAAEQEKPEVKSDQDEEKQAQVEVKEEDHQEGAPAQEDQIQEAVPEEAVKEEAPEVVPEEVPEVVQEKPLSEAHEEAKEEAQQDTQEKSQEQEAPVQKDESQPSAESVNQDQPTKLTDPITSTEQSDLPDASAVKASPPEEQKEDLSTAQQYRDMEDKPDEPSAEVKQEAKAPSEAIPNPYEQADENQPNGKDQEDTLKDKEEEQSKLVKQEEPAAQDEDDGLEFGE